MSVYNSFGGGKSNVATKSVMRLGRPSQYAVDGTGRDSYINQDNGGLYRAYEPAYNPDTGTFGTFTRKKFNTNAQFETKRT